MAVISPCVSICRIDPRTELCEGCYRSLTEIARWLDYTDAEKRAIVEALADRAKSAAD